MPQIGDELPLPSALRMRQVRISPVSRNIVAAQALMALVGRSRLDEAIP